MHERVVEFRDDLRAASDVSRLLSNVTGLDLTYLVPAGRTSF